MVDDFRENLIIDRYDPCFGGMRKSKKDGLRSENSEDVVTWNVFRSLRQVSPKAWIPFLAARAFGDVDLGSSSEPIVELWKDSAASRTS